MADRRRGKRNLERSSYQRLFDRDTTTQYELAFAALIHEAIEHVRNNPCDALLWAVAEPSAELPKALRTLTSTCPNVAVLIVFGGDDKGYLAECIKHGAVDAIRSKSLNATTLRLFVAAGIGKLKMGDAKLAERRAAAYQLVSEAVVNGWLTATQGWNPLLRKSRPEKFAEIAEAYEQVLVEWIRNKRENKRQSRAPLRHVGGMVEQVGGGAADIVDLHAHSVAKLVRGLDEAKARGAAWLAHGLALDLIGRLTEVKDRAPWQIGDAGRRTSSLSLRRNSEVNSLRRTSDIGTLRRKSDISTRRTSSAVPLRRPSVGFSETGAGQPGTENPFARRKSGARRPSDMIVDVEGRKSER